MDIALRISKSLAKKVVVARVSYTRRLDSGKSIHAADSEGEEDDDEGNPSVVAQEEMKNQDGDLWDALRPLEGDCRLHLITFDDPDGKMVRGD